MATALLVTISAVRGGEVHCMVSHSFTVVTTQAAQKALNQIREVYEPQGFIVDGVIISDIVI